MKGQVENYAKWAKRVCSLSIVFHLTLQMWFQRGLDKNCEFYEFYENCKKSQLQEKPKCDFREVLTKTVNFRKFVNFAIFAIFVIFNPGHWRGLGILLLPLDGMLVHRRLPSPRSILLGYPGSLPVPIYTPGWGEALWEYSVLPKNTTQWSQPALEHDQLDPESTVR